MIRIDLNEEKETIEILKNSYNIISKTIYDKAYTKRIIK